MEGVDLDRLVRDMIEASPNGQPIKPQIQIRGILPEVIGNEALLTQCISNLLSNGQKFVSAGTTPHLEIWADERDAEASECRSVQRESGERTTSESSSTLARSHAPNAPHGPTVRVWFKDNGLGIAPENHERIFRMFERIYPASEYEGTGIGLTIVRKAVERMGGQVGFDSELGKGSSFWIDLKKG
jgi:signal transduction histidine kinase